MAKKKIIGTCKLCLKPGQELQNSHIISEFFYKPIYENGRFQIFSSNTTNSSRIEQKGLREHLLCWSCEQKLGNWEKYVKELLFDRAPQGIDHGDRMEYPGVEYSQFKLFQMSLIWRLGITKHDRFSNVDLGRKHEDRLREMLDRSDPGEPYEYACFTEHVAYSIPEYGSVILPPTKGAKKFQGHPCYRTVLGGMVWCFFVSSHMAQFPKPEIFLSKSGVLPVWKESPSARKFVREWTAPIIAEHTTA
ncbi:MAG: hypothetical protein IPH05_17060 [Flavobacteriales bacterium]|jgi:hypothetical protein|nr:hypothetical protein [Flavobacteriales bacterium]MBK6549639.1 hypothetical protein [Flavobacteriales bacterium]MBK6884606.1 hypothetical protein [Flavobacteriales bacterium]MBK7103652.1 hypothetical protein [Flavobacteriales bacterium]MBK7111690.1 hypothetical protein [Flavobacteriales bacterium]